MSGRGQEEVRKLRAQGERMCVRRAELVVALPGAFQLRESEPCGIRVCGLALEVGLHGGM